MSEPTSNVPGAPGPAPPDGPPQKPAALFPVHRTWSVATGVAVSMVLLALLGVGLTTANSSAAATYWVGLVPVYGLLCVGAAWFRARHGGRFNRPVVLRQVFHWLGIGIALGLDFFIRGTGEESSLGAGMNALLLLALGCYLAGIHLEWLFIPVGVLLSAALVIVGKADQYLWLIFVVGGVTLAAMVGLQWWLQSERSRKAEAARPAPAVPAGS
jgi:hypothetical protein